MNLNFQIKTLENLNTSSVPMYFNVAQSKITKVGKPKLEKVIETI